MVESSSSKHAASSSTAPPPQQSSDGSCIATEAVTTQPAPQLATTVDERAQDQHHHDLEKQCTRGTIAPHHEGDHTAAAILAHPDGHDGDSARSSLNTDRDPEKGGNDTGLSTPHGITSSPAQSTRALTIIEDENFYPEGGLEAWLVVFGCWCSLLAALGVMNTLASFQANIHRNQLKGYTEGQIGWIFSVYAALSFGLGVFVGPIFDKFGARALMITGSVGVVVGMMLMSVCTGESPMFFTSSRLSARIPHHARIASSLHHRHFRAPEFAFSVRDPHEPFSASLSRPGYHLSASIGI